METNTMPTWRRRAVIIASLATLVVAGCGGGGGNSTANSRPGTTTTTRKSSGSPPLPSPLPPIRDRGTLDPVLGKFPTSETRTYQAAWVALGPKGREFTVALRDLDGYFKDYDESDLYLDGVIACTDARQNYDISSIIDDRGGTYQTDENPITDAQAHDLGASILAAAIEKMCPEINLVVNDPTIDVPTPGALRTILGVSSNELSDSAANKFANFVCQQIDRGTTQSRLVSNIADDFNYPDDLAEALVAYPVDTVC